MAVGELSAQRARALGSSSVGGLSWTEISLHCAASIAAAVLASRGGSRACAATDLINGPRRIDRRRTLFYYGSGTCEDRV